MPVFECRFLHSIGRIRGQNLLSNSGVRREALGFRDNSLEQALGQNRLKLSGHVLCIPKEQLLRCMLFCGAGSG